MLFEHMHGCKGLFLGFALFLLGLFLFRCAGGQLGILLFLLLLSRFRLCSQIFLHSLDPDPQLAAVAAGFNDYSILALAHNDAYNAADGQNLIC